MGPASPAAAAPADAVPPATITVCRDAYGGGEVVTVPFRDYVKTVLPFEFGADGAARAYLEAGAVAVKSFAWYYVLHPYRSTCHITDGGRHQHYRPGFRSGASDAAVDATWRLRMEEVRGGEVTPAFAQYCSRSCSSFPPGAHLDQNEARDQAAAGWSAVDILRHHYRAKDGLRIFDWGEGLGLSFQGSSPVPSDQDPFIMRASVRGVAVGDGRAVGRLWVECTLGGRWGVHHIDDSSVVDGGSGPEVRFDAAGVRGCEQHDVPVHLRLRVNGYLVGSTTVAVWDPWRSSSTRDVHRIAATRDPSAASVALSQLVFADVAPTGTTSADPLGAIGASETSDDGRRPARAVVIARSDRFPDALAASGLAGPDAPILLNPGGAGLRDDLAAEIERVLPSGSTVHLVGGEQAVSREVEEDPRLDRYEVVRHGGADRVATALAVADAIRASGGDTSVTLVARAWPDSSGGWADAVAVGGYAAARRHPLVLTRTGTMDAASESWIEDPGNGVGEAVLLGGPAAVPADAESRIDVRTTRIAGASRNETALAITERLWSRAGAPGVGGALIVAAWNEHGWPFALAASVYAANHGLPSLVVTSLVPRDTTGAWFDARPDVPAVIPGDGSIVSERVARDLAGG